MLCVAMPLELLQLLIANNCLNTYLAAMSNTEANEPHVVQMYERRIFRLISRADNCRNSTAFIKYNALRDWFEYLRWDIILYEGGWEFWQALEKEYYKILKKKYNILY